MSLRITEADLARLAGETPAVAHPRRGGNPETAIQTAIADALRWRGCYVERRNSGAVKTAKDGLVRLAPVGTPDLFVLIPPVVPGGLAIPAYVEVKRPGEQPTAAQQAKHRELRAFGAVVIVAHSVDEALALLAPYLEAQ